MIVSSEAIVLNSRKYGDTSKIIHAYTLEYGKQSFLAKGALQPKSKFGSSLDPLSYSSMTFYKKDFTELHLLSKSELVMPLRKIHGSYEHITAGLMMMETISQTQEQSIPMEELFALARDSVRKLNALPPYPNTMFIFFMIKLAEMMGYGLNFDYISKLAGKDLVYSPEGGGVVGFGNAKLRGMLPLTQEAYHIMKQISEAGFDSCDSIRAGAESESIYEFLTDYFSRHTGKVISLKSHNLLMV